MGISLSQSTDRQVELFGGHDIDKHIYFVYVYINETNIYTLYLKYTHIYILEIYNLYTLNIYIYFKGPYFLGQRLNLCFLHWKCEVLTTKPPVKSHKYILYSRLFQI